MRCVGLLGLCCVVLAHFACDVATLRSSVISSSFNSISMVISIFIFFQRTKHLLLARSDQNNPIHYWWKGMNWFKKHSSISDGCMDIDWYIQILNYTYNINQYYTPKQYQNIIIYRYNKYHKEIIYFSSWNIFSSLLINNIHCTLYKYTTVTQKESGRLGKKKKEGVDSLLLD